MKPACRFCQSWHISLGCQNEVARDEHKWPSSWCKRTSLPYGLYFYFDRDKCIGMKPSSYRIYKHSDCKHFTWSEGYQEKEKAK